jgi:hypothetical protein
MLHNVPYIRNTRYCVKFRKVYFYLLPAVPATYMYCDSDLSCCIVRPPLCDGGGDFGISPENVVDMGGAGAWDAAATAAAPPPPANTTPVQTEKKTYDLDDFYMDVVNSRRRAADALTAAGARRLHAPPIPVAAPTRPNTPDE